MSKEEENRLVDVMIDLKEEMKGMRKDMNGQLTGLNGQLTGLNHRVGKLEHSFEKMERKQHKTNILLAEHSRSIITLAEKFDGLHSDFNKYASSNNALLKGHEKRIVLLEDETLGGGGKTYMVKEPVVQYGKRKKRK